MIINFENKHPKIDKSAFIAENATIIGDVTIGKNVSIWYNVVLRGDVSPIIIGDNTNIQDGSVIHCDVGMPTIIGNHVTVGHNVTLHACEINDNTLIGIGSIILNGAIVGENSIIGAGAIVTPRTKIPACSMAWIFGAVLFSVVLRLYCVVDVLMKLVASASKPLPRMRKRHWLCIHVDMKAFIWASH